MATARASTHGVVVPKRREHLVHKNDECETGVETAVRGCNAYQAAGDHEPLCDGVLHAKAGEVIRSFEPGIPEVDQEEYDQ